MRKLMNDIPTKLCSHGEIPKLLSFSDPTPLNAVPFKRQKKKKKSLKFSYQFGVGGEKIKAM